MGLYWSVGLPGPFRLGGRAGGRRPRSRFTSAAYYWSCAFLVEGMFWLVFAVYWWLPKLAITAGVRAYRQHKAGRP